MLDLTGNKLLNAQAAALDAPALEAHTRLAEHLLGVDSAAFDGLSAPDQEIWTEMVALQVNFQQSLSDAEAFQYIGLSGHQQSFDRTRSHVSRAATALRDAFFSDGLKTGGVILGGVFSEEKGLD